MASILVFFIILTGTSLITRLNELNFIFLLAILNCVKKFFTQFKTFYFETNNFFLLIKF